MSSRISEEDHWDFTPVLHLLDSLAVGFEDFTEDKTISRESQRRDFIYSDRKGYGLEQGTQLGDFKKLWQYLGQPLNVPPPTISPRPKFEVIKDSENTGSYEQAPLKVVKWRDELEGGDLADNDEVENSQYLSGLNKQQRKKARRKQRREALAAGTTNGAAVPIGSENESDKKTKAPRTPDSKGFIYEIIHRDAPTKCNPEGIVSRLRSGKIYKLQDSIDLKKWPVASQEPVTPQPAKPPTQILKPPRESAYAAAAAKKATLIALLFETFIDERQYLKLFFIQNGNTNTDAAKDGIHVFVDASNVRSLLPEPARPQFPF